MTNNRTNNYADQTNHTPAASLHSAEPKAGLKIEDVFLGTGLEATAAKTISVHYVGRFLDGKEFDSSLPRKVPFKFKLGAGQVIAGWDQGVIGMKVGGKRKLTIPPELAYGATGAGNVIPAHATLIFDIDLVGVD